MENFQKIEGKPILSLRTQMVIGASLAASYSDIIDAQIPKNMQHLLMQLEEKEQAMSYYFRPTKDN